MSDKQRGLFDAHNILGIAPGADEQTIKRAYRRLAKKHHPDVNPGDLEAEKRFRDVQWAYDRVQDNPNSEERSSDLRGGFSDDAHPFFGFYDALRRSGLLKKRS